VEISHVESLVGNRPGLGRNIAEAVLASGDRLVATARDPLHVEDLAKDHGLQLHVASRDLNNEGAAQFAVLVAVDDFGRLDVVVKTRVPFGVKTCPLEPGGMRNQAPDARRRSSRAAISTRSAKD